MTVRITQPISRPFGPAGANIDFQVNERRTLTAEQEMELVALNVAEYIDPSSEGVQRALLIYDRDGRVRGFVDRNGAVIQIATYVTDPVTGALLGFRAPDGSVVTLAGGSVVDAVPTDGSPNAVSSNGVFDALAALAATIPPGAVSPDGNTSVSVSNGQIAFTVDGNPAGMIEWDAGMGWPKWTIGGGLDPMYYQGTARTLAQRDAMVMTSPAAKAGWLVWVVDVGVNEYQYWTGTAWVSCGGGSGVTSLSALTDVDLATTPPAAGNLLSYDGTAWVPVAPTPGAVIDAVPTDGSTNAVSSNGVFDALAAHVVAADPHPGYVLESTIAQPNGVAPLDATGRVPAAHLPSYVDDVREFANLAAFPATGDAGVIYIALDTGRSWRWSGSAYVEVVASPGTTDNVVEGSVNLYHTLARVRGTTLAGLSLADATDVTAADTVLSAVGKLQAQADALDAGKAPLVHTHVIADTTGLQTALDGKAALVHTHVAVDVTDFAPAVRATTLTGLSVATATDVVATDTVLGAIGKLQGQLDAIPPAAVRPVVRLSAAATNLVPGHYDIDSSGGAFAITLADVVGTWSFSNANRSLNTNAVTIGSAAQTYTNATGAQVPGPFVLDLGGKPVEFIKTATAGPYFVSLDVLTTAVIDSVPTDGSGNAVSSDGVFDGLANLQTQINALAAGVEFRGVWNATTPFPGGPGVGPGDLWIVSVAGTQDGETFAVGESLYALVANPSTTTFAGNWSRVAVAVPTTLDSLTDVDTTTTPPVVGSTLRFNGTQWVPGVATGSGYAGQVADVAARLALPDAPGQTAFQQDRRRMYMQYRSPQSSNANWILIGEITLPTEWSDISLVEFSSTELTLDVTA